jgi:hypothetical protein
LEGDCVAEGFELADVVAFLAVWADAGVVEVRAQVVEVVSGSASRCQMLMRMERPTATIARFLPRRLAIRRYRSPRKVSVLPATTATSPRTRAR